MKRSNKIAKPLKKSDTVLWGLIKSRIQNCEYIFSSHAKQRQIDRTVTDIDVLDILENKTGRNRKRNKQKDKHIPNHSDWNYCIEGNDFNNKRIRIIISFDSNLMLVITVIRIA